MTIKSSETADQPSIVEIQQAICNFRDLRNWRQFHSPKNLSMSIAIEAAELMEHFQWLTTEQATQRAHQDQAIRQAIGEELADVLIYCFSLADRLDFNIAEIILDKIDKNNEKYPVEESYGHFRKSGQS